MKTKIIKLDDIPADLERALGASYNISDIRDRVCYEDNCVIGDVEIAVANGESQLPATLLSRLPKLKLISVYGVGFDGVDVDYAVKNNIIVTNTPGVLTEDVADLAVTFALMMVREVVPAHAFVKNGEWQSGRYPLTRKFSARKVGIVGMGRVGKAICHRLEGFGCQIFYNSSKELPVNATHLADLQDMAAVVDILIVAANAHSKNNGLISLDVLSLLGPEGCLVNVSRGSLVNQQDLITALEEKRIAGAALDVLQNEPEVPERLIRPNVILTPHFASGTIETRQAMSQLVIDNINSFVAKQSVITPIDR